MSVLAKISGRPWESALCHSTEHSFQRIERIEGFAGGERIRVDARELAEDGMGFGLDRLRCALGEEVRLQGIDRGALFELTKLLAGGANDGDRDAGQCVWE